jgi:hypothetical protein
VAFVVTTTQQTAFAERLRVAGWVEVHADADGVVLARR